MVNVETEKRLVESVVQGLVVADLSKNLDRIMEFFSDEIIYQFPGSARARNPALYVQ